MRPNAFSSCDGDSKEEENTELGSHDQNVWSGTLGGDDVDPTSATPSGLGFPTKSWPVRSQDEQQLQWRQKLTRLQEEKEELQWQLRFAGLPEEMEELLLRSLASLRKQEQQLLLQRQAKLREEEEELPRQQRLARFQKQGQQLQWQQRPQKENFLSQWKADEQFSGLVEETPTQPASSLACSSLTTSSEDSDRRSDAALPSKRARQGGEGLPCPTFISGHPSNHKQRTGKADRKTYHRNYMDGGETCVVCDDSATGYHYSVMTCEGCKGFFRRTEQNRKQYMCTGMGKCTIRHPCRTACQSCRYQKCLDKGMATDLVLDETARKRRQQLIQRNREMQAWEAAEEATRSRNPAPTPSLTPSKLQFMESVELAFSAFLSENSQSRFTREARRVAGRETETLENFVRLMCNFFKSVPALGNVKIADCLPIQLRPSVVELCLLLVARTRVAPDCSFRTLEGDLTLQQLCERLPWLFSLLDHVLSIHTMLRACSLDDREFALLLIIVLLQTGRSSEADLSSDADQRSVMELRQEVELWAVEVLDLMIQYATLRVPGRGHLRQQVMQILQQLQNLSERPDLNLNIASTGLSALTTFTSLFFPPSSYL